MANSNCLEGIKCPDCGNEKAFHIQSSVVMHVTDDGTECRGDVEWDDDSYTQCCACERSAELACFNGASTQKAHVKPIIVAIEGGIVQDVTGLPAGYELHVEDRDEGDTSHPSWDAEKQCFVTVFEGDEV
jgi:hypothetical protein